MNYTEEAYLKIISNAVGNKNYDIDFSKVSVDRLKSLCGMHKTIALANIGMEKVKFIPEDIKKIFTAGLRREVFEYYQKNDKINKVSNLLSQRNVKHVLIKGKTVAKYYQQEELRRIGDVDLLISNKDKEIVKNILIENGGIYKPARSDEHVDYYIYDKLVVEVHSKIVAGKRFSDDNLYDNFSDIVYETSLNLRDSLYAIEDKLSLVYNIYHAAKHFYGGGCGIRMISDIWLIKEAIYDENKKDIDCQLERLGLLKFANQIFALGDIWFGNSTEKLDELDTIEEYVITSGIYGEGNVDNDVSQMRRNQDSSYIVKVIKWCFPSYTYMKEHCMWFENKPAILLPVAYIVRAIENIKKRGGVTKVTNKVIKGNKQNSRLEKILDIMELNNE